MTQCEFNTVYLRKNNAVIEKISTDKSVSYNLIYANVGHDMKSKKILSRDVTCKMNFRKEIFSELQEVSLEKYYDFQRRIIELEEKKNKLEMKKMNLEEKFRQSIPFIEENNYRYHKTVEFIKDDSRLTKTKKEEFQDINKETNILKKKKYFFVHANKQLKNYENFLMDVLNILPKDYVKGLKENNISALIRRCKSLFYINHVLYEDLNRSSALIRKLMIVLDIWYANMSSLQSHQSLIFPKMNNQLLELQNELSIRQTNYADQYQILRNKVHTLGNLIQAVNNITNKAFQILEKGFCGELELNLIPRIWNLDTETKFMRIEEFISGALQILEFLELKPTISL